MFQCLKVIASINDLVLVLHTLNKLARQSCLVKAVLTGGLPRSESYSSRSRYDLPFT